MRRILAGPIPSHLGKEAELDKATARTRLDFASWMVPRKQLCVSLESPSVWMDRLGGGALSSGILGFLLREILMIALSDRIRDAKGSVPSSSPFLRMVDRRLSIAQLGLAEAKQYLADGQIADADVVLEKIDEDLHLLRCRMSHEGEVLTARSSAYHGSVN